jgi:hypothetical protein
MSRPLRKATLGIIAMLSLVACGSTLEPRTVASQGTVVQSITGGGAPTTGVLPTGAATTASARPGGKGRPINVLPSQGTASTAATSGEPTTPGSSAPGSSTPTGPAVGTHTPITVGFPYLDAAASASVLSGIGKGLASADSHEVAELEIARINKAGGLSGHPIKPYFYDINPNTAQATYEQGACDDFTQDHPVQVVMDFGMTDNFVNCALAGGVPGIINANVSGYTSSQLASTPGAVFPNSISLDRLAKIEVQKLAAAHWFQPGAKVGILYYDTAPYVAAEKDLEADLWVDHINVQDRIALGYVGSTGALTQLLTQMQGADLRFRSEGISNLMFVENAGFLAAAFGLEAGPQGYYPKYALSSDAPLGAIDANISARELQGAAFVGWIPAQDVGGTSNIPAGGKACMAYMSAHGQPFITPNEKAGSIQICDEFDYLKAVVAKIPAGQSVTRSSFINATHSVGSSYHSDQTFGVDTAGRTDGVDTIRMGDYSAGCKCFQYTSGRESIG